MGKTENRIKKVNKRINKLRIKINRASINKNFESRYGKDGVFSQTNVYYEELKNKELELINELKDLDANSQQSVEDKK